MRILILGGYGTFGGRLAQQLAADAGLHLIIAGRSLVKAQAGCEALPPGGVRQAVALDRNGDLAAAFATLRPDLVVDASGPFQAYGADPYRVARAALTAGAHYLDLADDRAFVSGIGALGAEAKAAGRFAIAGASTYPAISMAAARELATGLSWVYGVWAGITPSPQAPIGVSVVQGVTGYGGKPMMVRRKGKERRAWAWTESTTAVVAPPGAVPLPPVRFSLVDAPDLEALPRAWVQLRTAWTGAGPRPHALHLGLNALAWLVRLKILPSLRPMAGLFHRAMAMFGRGEDRGGMLVRVTGYMNNRPVDRSWHLIAEGAAGPLIPTLPAQAIIARCLAGTPPAPGARSCAGELSLADLEPMLAARGIVTGRREKTSADVGRPLYRRVLEDRLDALPEAVRDLHLNGTGRVYAGRATVERGRGPLAGLAAALFNLPRAGADLPVRVAFLSRGGAEVWRREFDGRQFESVLSQGDRGWDGLVRERFGPLAVGMALTVDGDRLGMVVRRWSLLGIAMPAALAPRGEVFETEHDGRFHFDVEMAGPLTGLIVRYRGWLEPTQGAPRAIPTP